VSTAVYEFIRCIVIPLAVVALVLGVGMIARAMSDE